MFASKTPRDLNRDPRPYRHAANEARVKHYIEGQEAYGWAYDPRPEYDHAQHNEPNPILLAFRQHRTWEWVYINEDQSYAESVERFDGLRDESFMNVSPEQINHARRVLTRLASITRPESGQNGDTL